MLSRFFVGEMVVVLFGEFCLELPNADEDDEEEVCEQDGEESDDDELEEKEDKDEFGGESVAESLLVGRIGVPNAGSVSYCEDIFRSKTTSQNRQKKKNGSG